MHPSSRTHFASAALVSTLLVGSALTSRVIAHHSFTAVYDVGTEKEIEGRLAEIRWINPHIKMSVTVAGGQTWAVEAGPVNLLERMDIKKTMLKVGDTIRVRGNPSRASARGLWVSNILLPDKTELLFAPGAKPYGPWASARRIGNPTILDNQPGDLASGTGHSFYRIWSPVDVAAFPKPRGAPVLTDAGRRAQARYGIGKKVITDCETPGMPFAMMSPYPIEIVQQGGRLLIRGEAYDVKRLVYLAAPATPPAASPLGLSIGRIMGDELVIETSRINYHSYGDLGPAQSNQSHVVERFTLSADGLKLDYAITVTDPVMLGKPWSWGGSFVSKKGAEIRKWSCGASR